MPGIRSVDAACASVRELVERTGNAHDLAYYNLHEARFRKTAQRITELVPRGARVLDVGSHYLHQAAVLKQLGYSISAMDVPAHARLGFVSGRGRSLGIENYEVSADDFSSGSFLGAATDAFDCIVFCEILEHITFNPVNFWRRMHKLLRVNGLIYLTTPNSVKLLSIVGAVWNAVTLRRIGLSVNQIFHHVTYGHHWKEYSANELVEYFRLLSPDFEVSVRRIHYGAPPPEVRRHLGKARTTLLRLGNASRALADNLEAVIRLPRKSAWRTPAPVAG
jgi:2-polyprenyl-3-methyl-5-hydroxy-6-metoxy-1,4-benzoquinol methylase